MAHSRKRLFDPFPVVVSHILTIQFQILPSRHFLIKAGCFDDGADPLEAFIAFVSHPFSENPGFSRIRMNQVHHHFHHRAFSRPVRAHKAVNFSLSDVQIHPFHRRLFPPGFGQIPGFHQKIHLFLLTEAPFASIKKCPPHASSSVYKTDFSFFCLKSHFFLTFLRKRYRKACSAGFCV